jgi:TM2 domain-containing membrane protein YozV
LPDQRIGRFNRPLGDGCKDDVLWPCAIREPTWEMALVSLEEVLYDCASTPVVLPLNVETTRAPASTRRSVPPDQDESRLFALQVRFHLLRNIAVLSCTSAAIPRKPLNTHGKTHSILFGYILWLLGFTGAHRFYYGKPASGTIYLLTFGLFLIGWIVDLFLIPSMDRQADLRFRSGPIDYNIAWILLTFLGIFGAHRMYMGKWITGVLFLLTGGFFLLGVIYDFWTLNDQITMSNSRDRS